MDPFIKFNTWYKTQLDATNTLIPSACCLSTTGIDGYPNARFVSLKEVKSGQFIISGPIDSRKGQEIKSNPRAALTFWWPDTEKQVRVQGDVKLSDSSESDRFFKTRKRESQIISWVSKQGRPFENGELFNEKYTRFSALYESKEIPRPANWTGIAIVPVCIEFLSFSEKRFHKRELYIVEDGIWQKQILQP